MTAASPSQAHPSIIFLMTWQWLPRMTLVGQFKKGMCSNMVTFEGGLLQYYWRQFSELHPRTPLQYISQASCIHISSFNTDMHGGAARVTHKCTWPGGSSSVARPDMA
eukprot:1161298-Pelagomonas_calceolata.AAC.11